jgi:hypothetical protein
VEGEIVNPIKPVRAQTSGRDRDGNNISFMEKGHNLRFNDKKCISGLIMHYKVQPLK